MTRSTGQRSPTSIGGLLANPSYYSLPDRSNDALSKYLSDLVEDTLGELAESKIIEFDDEDGTVTPQNAATIAAYLQHLVHYHADVPLVSHCADKTQRHFGDRHIRHRVRVHSDQKARRWTATSHLRSRASQDDAARLRLALTSRAFVLLQAHFSRMQLPIDLAKDQEVIVSKVLSLLSAMVDILSSEVILTQPTRWRWPKWLCRLCGIVTAP